MKKFLEELDKAKNIYGNDILENEAQKRYKAEKQKYSKLVGCRAIYRNKNTKESRVVKIEQVTDNFVILSYKYHTINHIGKIRITVSYPALICKDETIEVEK